MLSLAEYTAFKAEMKVVGDYFSAKAVEETATMPKQWRVKQAQEVYKGYHVALKVLMLRYLHEIAQHNLDYHYDGHAPDGLAEALVDELTKEAYYGATFNQRMAIQQRRLMRSVAISDPNVIADHMVRNDSAYMRIFLGTSLKLEQNIAVHTAREKDIPFIRWSLSHKHKTPDVCDDLANNVDKQVVAKIRELDLNIDPKGLYLRDQLPHPPHPNCQCEYMPEAGLSARQRGIRRTLKRIRTLLRRIRRK